MLLCILNVLEAMCCVPLCMLEAVEGKLCLLELFALQACRREDLELWKRAAGVGTCRRYRRMELRSSVGALQA